MIIVSLVYGLCGMKGCTSPQCAGMIIVAHKGQDRGDVARITAKCLHDVECQAITTTWSI
eukprot:3899055-Amphidinium_carterae.1